MLEPKVSIIIPSYNHDRFLEKRLQSIASQTYKNVEIIIFDDCSTDNSVKTLSEFASRYAKVKAFQVSKKNSGSAFSQWLKGFALASGKYTWIAETDDYCEPEFLATLVKNIQNSPNSSISYCHSVWVDESDNNLGTMELTTPYFDIDYWSEDTVLDGDFVNKTLMPYRNVIRNASAAIFDTDRVKSLLTVLSPKTSIDDWHFYIELLKSSSVCFSSRQLNYCRLHSDNHSRALTSDSYRQIISARLTIFARLSRMYGVENTTIKEAFRVMWSNRGKYKATERLSRLANKFGRFALYGFNDLSKYFLACSNDYPSLIIDQRVSNSLYQKVPIANLTSSNLHNIDTVAIMSLHYKEQMKNALKQAGFEGQIVCVQ